MKLAFRMALKFILSSKAQSILIVTGISVGISVQLFIGLLIQGLQSDLVEKTIGNSSHIVIKSNTDTFEVDNQLLASVDIDNVIKISPTLSLNVLVNIENQGVPITINGVDFNADISNVNSMLIEGNIPLNKNQILVGNAYDVNIGEKLTFISSNGDTFEYEVSGIYKSGVKNVNERIMYTDLLTLQSTLNLQNNASAIELQVKDVYLSPNIAEQIQNIIGSEYNVIDWQEENTDLLSALSSQSLSSYIIQVCVIISVALAITSVLIISVVQKSKQIGILKAIGLNDTGISQVFIFQGLILGVIGSLLGILLGIALLFAFTTFAVDENGKSVITILYDRKFILISFGVGVTSALFASLIPAQKSKKLSAIEVISNG